jgi:hypothetical protein
MAGFVTGPERRLSSNRPLSAAVEFAITRRQTAGESAAKRIFLIHSVPSTIAARVLFHAENRRVAKFKHVQTIHRDG